MGLFDKLKSLVSDDKKDTGTIEIIAPLSGEIVNIEDVPDVVFAEKIVGDGIAIKPTGNKMVAPVDGTIGKIFETNHAFSIESDSGVELFVHFGIDTVELKGEGFKRIAEEGQRVKVGDTVIEFDLPLLEEKAKSTLTPVVISNMDEIKVEICFSELDESQLKEHDHTFFELVYILSGTGIQWINNNKFPYHDGHLFMITPGDIHSFDIHTTTKFVYIKFNDIYIHSAVFGTENIQRLEFILQHANHRPGCILRNQTDKLLVKPMIEAIIREYVNRNIYSSEIITQLINTIVIVVARNIAMFLPEQINENSEEKSLNILQYIQSNICYPEKIKTKAISQHFGISPNYLGRYFKKQTNETMQQYILNYKMKMVESRLLHSEMRISEIVEELGFTDESHLNRLFKRYKDCNPTDFRKKHRGQ